jgi:hypothetical protein
MVIQEPECALWRTRRGGKTLLLANVEVFWAMIQFGEYKGKVVHRTPGLPQLYQYQDWAKLNPFTTNIDNQSHYISVLDSEAIWGGCTGKYNSDGYGCSVLVEDEWGKIGLDDINLKYLESTRVFIAEGPATHKRHLMASTATYGSIFAHDLELLEDKEELTGRSLIHQMPWTDCPWITREYIEEERRKHFDDPSFVDQQFNCLLVPSHGLFFKPDRWHIMTDQEVIQAHKTFPTNTGGLDWNGSKVGHVGGMGHWDSGSRRLYIYEEPIFDTTTSVDQWVRANTTIPIEVEGQPKQMGYNAGFSQNLHELHTPCMYQNWEETTKDSRLALLQNGEIWIAPSCKWAIKGFREAIFDPKSLIPRLLKTNVQHGLDYALHMVHQTGAGVHIFEVPTQLSEGDSWIEQARLSSQS